jgi:hypothetical protein
MIRSPRRTGTTLMEVMIATAILAIGILAIMALFPIGALNMARAINQNRAADHAQSSDALFRIYWKRVWIDPNGGGVRTTPEDAYLASLASGLNEEMIPLLDRTRPFNFAVQSTIPPTSSQPSFPVLVDPIGFRTQPAAPIPLKFFVGGQAGLPARTSLAVTNADPTPRTLIRNTTLLDDMTFDGNGEPADLGTGQLQRGGRYNVSWLIQRPKNNVPYEVNLTVLVFAGRSPTDKPSDEIVLPAIASGYIPNQDPKPRGLVVTFNGAKPPAIRGKWLAFSTPIQPLGPPNGIGVPYQCFDFYRIASVTDLSDTTLGIEIEQPLRTYDASTLTQLTPTGDLNGAVVFFDDLFEVFDRGTVSAAAIAGR